MTRPARHYIGELHLERATPGNHEFAFNGVRPPFPFIINRVFVDAMPLNVRVLDHAAIAIALNGKEILSGPILSFPPPLGRVAGFETAGTDNPDWDVMKYAMRHPAPSEVGATGRRLELATPCLVEDAPALRAWVCFANEAPAEPCSLQLTLWQDEKFTLDELTEAVLRRLGKPV